MTATPLPRSRNPRLGGLFLRLARATTRLVLPFAGKRWFGFFSIVRHIGRRSGTTFETPVAARRIPDGFVLALAFGSEAHWHRNLRAARGGVIRWRGVDYPVGAPAAIDRQAAFVAFLPIQRMGLRALDIDGYIHVPDAPEQVAR